jgi:site-specific recombinase XerD
MQHLSFLWPRIAKAAQLQGVRLHDLRHSYASVLVSGGASLPLIGHLLGHSQSSATQRYAHLFDQPLREATERASAFFEAASAGTGKVVALKRPKRE